MMQDNKKNKLRLHPDVIFIAKVWAGVALLAVLVDFFDVKLGVERYAEQEKVTVGTPRDGTKVGFNVPSRTNTGDTLYVLDKFPMNENRVHAKRTDGTTGSFVFQNAQSVNPGDTIVVNSEHEFVMKNITQRNLERQK